MGGEEGGTAEGGMRGKAGTRCTGARQFLITTIMVPELVWACHKLMSISAESQ